MTFNKRLSSGVAFNAVSQISLASCFSPITQSTSPRCAAISGSLRNSNARRK